MNATEMMQFATHLERYCFEKYVLEVCVATLERGGATSKLDTYEFVPSIDAWYSVSRWWIIRTFVLLA